MALDESPYATLEVPRTATPEQIEAAYHRLKGLLADGQLAAYGMLDMGETHRQREQLDLAFDILSNPATRQNYDAQTFHGNAYGDSAPYHGRGAYDGPIAGHSATLGERYTAGPPPVSVRTQGFRRRGRMTYPCPLAEECGPETQFDGPLLRRLRESAGASLEAFCESTKISRRYLKAIEADDHGLLPAPVYVRGFVSEYARLLGLEAKRVADSYLMRAQARR